MSLCFRRLRSDLYLVKGQSVTFCLKLHRNACHLLRRELDNISEDSTVRHTDSFLVSGSIHKPSQNVNNSNSEQTKRVSLDTDQP